MKIKKIEFCDINSLAGEWSIDFESPDFLNSSMFCISGPTGSGKTSCALALSALFSCPDYDFSDTLVVSVGCAGGSAECTTLGDVVIVTAACDNELGHTADVREFEDTDADVTWFHDGSYDSVSSKLFDRSLAEKAYELASSVPLRSTETSKSVLEANFPSGDPVLREPAVIFGTALSGDSYWKGEYGHRNAEAIVEHYSCPDPYAVTEMEDLTVANVAECFGLSDRVVTFRTVVDLDVFLGDDTPESLWSGDANYNDSVSEAGSASIDVFEPAMHNLFDAASPVIDAALAGKLK